MTDDRADGMREIDEIEVCLNRSSSHDDILDFWQWLVIGKGDAVKVSVVVADDQSVARTYGQYRAAYPASAFADKRLGRCTCGNVKLGIVKG